MLIHSHDYDNSYYPAMPMIEIQLRHHAKEAPVVLQAIVDTGADATMIPLRFLRQLRTRKTRTVWLSGTAGGRYKVDLYSVAIQISDHRLLYVDVVGSERQNEVIVGRDVLNQYILMLNGLAHVVELST